MNLNLGHALGLFAGSGTSTPTLQAAIATLGNDDPAVGYSVSYPFGVAGPILFLYVDLHAPEAEDRGAFGRRHGAARDRRAQSRILRQDARRDDGRAARRACRSPPCAGRSQNEPAFAEHRRRRRRRRCSSSAPARTTLDQARKASAKRRPAASPRIGGDLDYIRVFASRPAVVGRALGDIDLPGEKASIVLHVRRGDADLMPRPDLVLEFGDRIGMLANRCDFARAAQVLRRLDQGHGGVQLHLDRPRHGARLPDRRDPDSDPRHRQDRRRLLGRADRRADPRQPAPHRRHELDDPAVGEPRAAQPRAHAVPGPGRDGVRAQVRRDGQPRPVS